MKKILFIFIAALFLITIPESCQRKTPGADKPFENIDPFEKQKSTLHEKIMAENYILEDNPDIIGNNWAKLWLNSIYSDYGLSEIKAYYKEGASFDEVSGGFEIRAYRYSVQFSSQQPVPGSETSTEGKSTIEVLVVALEKGGKIILSGFLGPGEFEEYTAAEKIYDVVAKDSRYSSKLKPFPRAMLPEEIEEIDVGAIIQRDNYSFIGALPGGKFAAISSEKAGDTIKQRHSVSLFDLESKKVYKNLELGEYSLDYSRVEAGRLVISLSKYDTWARKLIYIDKDGSMVSEDPPEGIYNMLYSPDKSKFAYREKGNLYVRDVGENKPRLLLKGKDTGGDDTINYYPFYWMDDTNLTYGISAYESSYGCGIINTETGEDTFFEQAGRYAMPYTIINGKLYTIIGAAGEPFDPGVLDLKAPGYPWRRVFKDISFMENTYTEGYAFSPDGTKIALLKTSLRVGDKNTLYICSTEDGSIIKSYEFRAGYCIPQYLDYLEDGRIAIYAGRYAYSPIYMYIVKP